jgi:hypothetical protein
MQPWGSAKTEVLGVGWTGGASAAHMLLCQFVPLARLVQLQLLLHAVREHQILVRGGEAQRGEGARRNGEKRYDGKLQHHTDDRGTCTRLLRLLQRDGACAPASAPLVALDTAGWRATARLPAFVTSEMCSHDVVKADTSSTAVQLR